jgi:hypothetical protein
MGLQAEKQRQNAVRGQTVRQALAATGHPPAGMTSPVAVSVLRLNGRTSTNDTVPLDARTKGVTSTMRTRFGAAVALSPVGSVM